jgi:hypothetical protein
MTTNRAVALRFAAAGVPIFPCRNCPNNKESHKTPLVKWRHESTTDQHVITRWWDRWPNALPGIDLGKAGMIVFDGDRHPDANGVINQDGVAALDRIFRRHGIDPKSIPTVITPSGGCHCYFQQPEGLLLGNREGSLRGLGVNVRGHGGFVIASGAEWLDGRCYRWDQTTKLLYRTSQRHDPGIAGGSRRAPTPSPKTHPGDCPPVRDLRTTTPARSQAWSAMPGQPSSESLPKSQQPRTATATIGSTSPHST